MQKVKHLFRFALIFSFLIVLFCQKQKSKWDNITPLPRAHAHNDYAHQRPLFEALEHGFTSIEADILRIDNRLLVGHDPPRPGENFPTLDSLYLQPLFTLIKSNGNRIFKNYSAPLILLIDIKTDADSTYDLLKEYLKPYQKWLTFIENSRLHPGPVQVLISGNRPIRKILQDSLQLAGLDGRPSDLGQNFSPQLMPIVSDAYRNYASWKGKGQMPDTSRVKIKALALKVHQENKRLRLWGTPDTLTVWQTLSKLGVDILNADDLDGLQHYLLSASN